MGAFDQLDVKKRYELLRKEASRVLTVSHQHFCVTLYLFNGRYYESYFNVKSLKVEKVNPLENIHIDKYLEYITIHDIYWLL
jgi:hypothetical protein